MNEAEFDRFADEYYTLHAASIAASGEGPDFFAEYKIRDIAREYEQQARLPNPSLKILDFGAGIGGSVPYVQKHIPNAQLTCLDLSQRSLEIAEKRFPSLAQYAHFDGTRIPFPEEHFDIAYAMCVFHHIDHAEHIPLLQELRRVLRPGGSLFIFEHNPNNPLTVRVVNSCPFDENARLIKGGAMKQQLLAAGFASAMIRYRIFFPHLLRVLRPLERLLTWLPLGGQYYVLSRK
jgi:ubiquinone/menaquinone biosynthesis C-methylase UbiE